MRFVLLKFLTRHRWTFRTLVGLLPVAALFLLWTVRLLHPTRISDHFPRCQHPTVLETPERTTLVCDGSGRELTQAERFILGYRVDANLMTLADMQQMFGKKAARRLAAVKEKHGAICNRSVDELWRYLPAAVFSALKDRIYCSFRGPESRF